MPIFSPLLVSHAAIEKNIGFSNFNLHQSASHEYGKSAVSAQ
jgi:hypothetical protein